MVAVEIVARTRQIALDLAAVLSEDDRLRVVRAGAMTFGFRPRPEAEVILAWDVPIASMPSAGPGIVLLSDSLMRVRQDRSLRSSLPLNASPLEIAAAIIAAQAGLTH